MALQTGTSCLLFFFFLKKKEGHPNILPNVDWVIVHHDFESLVHGSMLIFSVYSVFCACLEE